MPKRSKIVIDPKVEAELRVSTAIDNLMEMYYEEEREAFFGDCYGERCRSYKAFVKELKKHVFYSLIVLKYNGDQEAIENVINEYWDIHREDLDEL
jgi:hypothetical protein